MKKLSAHCNITNPEEAGYPYLESIESFANLCDEVVVVDGGSTDGSLEEIAKIDKVKIIQGQEWERDFDWTVMPKNLQIGLEACSGEWAFHFDVDYIFHEDDVKELRELIAKTDMPAIEVRKVNFVLINENFTKGYFPLIINKSYNAVQYGIGKDLKGNKSSTFLKPISKKGSKNKDGLYEGDVLQMSSCRLERSQIPIYTYDFSFMDKEQIIEQRTRFDNSLAGYKGTGEVSSGVAFKKFMAMMQYRHKICKKKVKLEEHSKFIRDKVKNIKPEHFGCNGFKEL